MCLEASDVRSWLKVALIGGVDIPVVLLSSSSGPVSPVASGPKSIAEAGRTVGKFVKLISSMRDLTPSASIRLLIVDDHAVVRAGFSSVLRRQVGLDVVGSVRSGEEALTFLEHCSVEVLLLDLHMPGMSGIETLLALQELPCPPNVIVLSSFEPDEEICRAVERGANGYLRKDISCADIIEAIHAVHSGRSHFPQWIKDRVSERKLQPSLSPRELEILEMVAKGLTNKEIGRAIQVSHFTVRNHVRHIIAKLEVGDRTEATTVAIQQGILMA